MFFDVLVRVFFTVGMICLGFLPRLTGQEIFVNSNNELYRLNLQTCGEQLVTSLATVYTDISFHPNGNLYGIDLSGRIDLIDRGSGVGTQRALFPEDGYTALTISATGELFAMTFDGKVYSHRLNSGMYTNYGSAPAGASGDLAFYQGELYAAVTGNRIMRVDLNDPMGSEIVVNQNVEGQIFGIVSFANDCDDLIVYAIATREETNGLFSRLLRIDFDAGSYTEVCDYELNVLGGASAFDFFGSAPISLDSVNVRWVDCAEQGRVEVFASGGVGDFVYNLEDFPDQASGLFTGVPSGIHQVLIRDENDCQITREVELINPDGPGITDIQVEDGNCDATQKIVVIIADGLAPFSYSVDNGRTYRDGNRFSGLAAGDYRIRVRDAEGCVTFRRFEFDPGAVQIDILAGITINVEPACVIADNIVSVNHTDPALILRYSLDGTDFREEGVFTAVAPGTYDLFILEESGCVNSASGVVVIPEPLTAPSVMVTATSCGAANGTISVNETAGGRENLGYAIGDRNFTSSRIRTDLPAGEYPVTVEDELGCREAVTVSIAASATLRYRDFVATGGDCEAGGGSITFGFEEPDVAVTVNGEAVGNQTAFTGLTDAVYLITAVTPEGCRADTTINFPPQPCPIYLPTAFSPNGDGINDIFAAFPHPGTDATIVYLAVFDRWGGEVARLDDQPFNGQQLIWDGRVRGEDAAPGTYTYTMRVVFRNGAETERAGVVVLVR